MKFVSCTVCDQKFCRLALLLTHVKKNHRNDPRFRYQCSLCNHISKSYRMFLRHFQKNHGNFSNVEEDDYNSQNHADIIDANQDTENGTLDLQVEAAKSILCIKEGNMISEVATNRIVEQMQSMIELHMERVKDKLKELGTPLEIVNALDKDVLSCDVFRGLETQSQREETFPSLLGLMKPQPIELGSTLQWTKNKEKPELKEVKATGYFIPFLESLQRLVCHKDFSKAIKKIPEADCNNIFKDISDGSFYRNHPILCDKNSLAIVAYYDDVEVTNPLGSKIKTHKLAVFYWYVANIDPAYRSQLSIINLLAVAKTKHIRQFGVNSLLQNFLNGLNMLKTGYSFNSKGEEMLIKGALLAFPSDTLASNYIGGFKESPSFSFSPCRLCTVKKSVMKSVISEDEVTLRNSIKHADQVKKIENQDLSKHAHAYWSKMYGIVRKSVFSETPFFDVTKCFVLDIMHVLFEGVVLQEIKQLLYHCLEAKYFSSFDIINRKLKIFSFNGASSSDCPTELDAAIIKDPQRKIKQNAAQSWQLAVMLPFLIGQYVPDEDEHYENFINLLKIVTLSVSFEISCDDVLMLKQLISIYIANFIKLYGNNNFTPKMHYLIHLPKQVLMFGPPRYLWCFRLEAKHRRLKQIVLVSQNYKNVSLTVAKRLEAFACLEHSQASEFLLKKLKMSNCNHIEKESIPSYVTLNVNEEDSIIETKNVTFRNISYKYGLYLLYEISEHDFPKFMLIKHMYCVNDIIFFVCQLQNTIKYNKKYNSYIVNAAQYMFTVQLANLKYEHPVYATIFQRETHIIVHHYSCIDFDYC